MTIHETLQDGRLATLQALRDRLARDIDQTTSKRDVASLALRLQSVLADIDEIEGGSANPASSPADEIAARRRARELERGA